VVKPHEVYNLAAQSHVHNSFQDPLYTANVIATGTGSLLEALRDYRDNTGIDVRFYQAGSSEMFGRAAQTPQNEQTPFRPASPYACAKVHAHWLTVMYREAHGLHACNGILYNHESPRRPPEYVTRKVTRAAARIKAGLEHELVLGNLDARRDWGFAGDYVDAMWRIMQAVEPDDFVIATGETHSVRDLLATAFGAVELDWRACVRIDERLLRPAEPTLLCGDASKARRMLGWKPSVDFRGLVRMMVAQDMRLAERESGTLVRVSPGSAAE
jgi:GDPmannose 4,6-dehydratase